jgi:hypothetical protein
LKFKLLLRPFEKVADLPVVKVPDSHLADRLVVEEWIIGLARPGEWGEIVPDEDAENGFAAKLFNTHYEWCMQWSFDPIWFAADARYKVRMRIRVEKTARQGEAFWAGVYDVARKKGHGQISPKTTEVGDGYQWYDVATWLPETNQYIWAGPGRFDKAAGEPSAIQALYVDKFEMVREKPGPQ